jgi:hypothetical protein
MNATTRIGLHRFRDCLAVHVTTDDPNEEHPTAYLTVEAAAALAAQLAAFLEDSRRPFQSSTFRPRAVLRDGSVGE